jgi:hypothetical protein
MRVAVLGCVVGILCCATARAAESPAEIEPRILFDFENAADIAAWKNVPTPNASETDKKKIEEPPAKLEVSDKNAAGKGSLKITFDGGTWPTIANTPPADIAWNDYKSFRATVTVDRACVVGFRIMQEKSLRGGGYEPSVTRWEYTQFLQPGKNVLEGPFSTPSRPALPDARGKASAIEFYMYQPHKGETIYVDDIRLSKDAPEIKKQETQFKVLGTDLVVKDVAELLKTKRHAWVKTEPRTVAQIDADFRTKLDELKKTNPTVVLAIFRDGEKGWDPANPDKVYDGWRDAHVNSHGPDGNLDGRAAKTGKNPYSEMFMRHRSRMMRIDVASIPANSTILAAEMSLVRVADDKGGEKATMWVAEACNREWDEHEVNAYQFAKDKFWKAIGGMHYGDDPDFLPIYLAHGPSNAKVATWDFTEAVKYWNNPANKNHGFFWHTTPDDFCQGGTPTRETRKIEDRPVLRVIYVPAQK